jgi:bisphosphoglycerate-independent phosphoglycerate mutase (AlkP superfamily)
MLWIRTPERKHYVNSEKVPLVSVAPTLLQLLGLSQPASMKASPIALPQRRVA